MGTSDQRFNVDVAFLFGSIWTDGTARGTEDSRQPNWTSGLTDWGRRTITLPKIQKSVENWSGKLQSSDITLDIFDGDGSVYATLNATRAPFGKEVAMFSKITENPDYWSPVFAGNITGITRAKALTTVRFSDALRNLHNSQFVRDYYCAATNIGGKLYGTVKDVMGTNVYIDDRGNVTQIKREIKGDGGGWLSMIFGGIIGAGAGAIKGGPVGAAIGGGAGLLSGLSGLIGGQGDAVKYYYRVEDYNTIPDDLVFGGQKLKFYFGSTDGGANGVTGPLYSSPAYTVKGGTFATSLYGTIEVDDIYHNIRKGDTLYVELPLVFFGSPDEIIVSMLTGSNVTVPFNFPEDFATNWDAAAEPLKHIECWNFVESTDAGGITEQIEKLCSEFGFTFYINERNQFAIRTVRNVNTDANTIIGTLDERYNVLQDGFSVSEDINDAYTDLTLRYRPTADGGYDGEIRATTQGATYFGGARKALVIDSQWIHDAMTGEFMATRLMRRFATVVRKAEADVSLYAVPVALAEMMKCTGWAIGTNRTYEIVGYTKDFQSNKCTVELEDAEPIYHAQKYGYFATSGSVYSGCPSGWATIICGQTGTLGNAGTVKEAISNSQSELTLYFLATPGAGAFDLYGTVANIEGSYFRIGTRGEEILRAFRGRTYSTTIGASGYLAYEWRVERGCFNTGIGQYEVGEMAATVANAYATTFNGADASGTFFRWF